MREIIDPERPTAPLVAAPVIASLYDVFRFLRGLLTLGLYCPKPIVRDATGQWTDTSKWHVYELIDGPWWWWTRLSGPELEFDEEGDENPDEVIACGISFDEARARLEELRNSGKTQDDGPMTPKTRDWFLMLPSHLRPNAGHVEIVL